MVTAFLISWWKYEVCIFQTGIGTIATGIIIDIMLTNKLRSFQKTSTITTGISDCHKMIVTCLKAHFKKLPPKKIVCRDYQNFNRNTFLYYLNQNLIQGKFYSQKSSYDLFTETFKSVVDHHVTLKKETCSR